MQAKQANQKAASLVALIGLEKDYNRYGNTFCRHYQELYNYLKGSYEPQILSLQKEI